LSTDPTGLDGRDAVDDGAPDGDGSNLVYAVFQGGGAKGITHIGGLSAVNERGLFIVGAAGASAGAIIAALVAVGYGGDELFDAPARTDLLHSKYGKVPTQLLGEGEWEEATWAFRMLPYGVAIFVYNLVFLALYLRQHPLVSGTPRTR